MLIIEGPDMLGKTTFARKLVAAIPNLSIDKFGLPEADYSTAKEWTDRYDPMKICDRYVISEPIYGLICRGATKTPIDVWNEIWWRLSEMGGCSVLLYATHPDCYRDLILPRRYDAKREAFSPEQCQQVNDAYWHLAHGEIWKGYRIPRVHNVHVQTVQVERYAVPGGEGIEQPDTQAGRFAAKWLSWSDERQIINHLWRNK